MASVNESTIHLSTKVANISLLLLWTLNYFIIIPLYINIPLMSSLIIYIGSYRSIALMNKELLEQKPVDESDRAILTHSDAYKFPFIASFALFGFYLAFKYFDKDMLNYIISIYFTITATISLTPLFSSQTELLFSNEKKYVSSCQI
jgi:hypothetical protein